MISDFIDEELPTDKELVRGRLNNGLKYYIRKNLIPEKECIIGLVVKAGSVVEEENEKGIAHFVEHVALSHYDVCNEIIQMSGYTDFHETCFIANCSFSNSKVIEEALERIRGISKEVSFLQECILKEKEIIIQEIRRVNNRSGSSEKNNALKAILNGSHYDERIPIGDEGSVNSIKESWIINFYRKWYKPELMAVIAVGDFDIKKMEQMIIEKFEFSSGSSELGNIEDSISHLEVAKVMFNINEKRDTSEMSFYFKRNRESIKTIDDYKVMLLENLFLNLLTNFIGEYDGNYATHDRKQFNKSYQIATISVALKELNIENQVEHILEGMTSFKNKVKVEDLQAAKEAFLQCIKVGYEEKDKVSSSVFFYECIRNFIVDEPIVSMKDEMLIVQDFINEITIEKIVEYSSKFFSLKDVVIAFNLNGQVNLNKIKIFNLVKNSEFMKDINVVLW